MTTATSTERTVSDGQTTWRIVDDVYCAIPGGSCRIALVCQDMLGGLATVETPYDWQVIAIAMPGAGAPRRRTLARGYGLDGEAKCRSVYQQAATDLEANHA